MTQAKTSNDYRQAWQSHIRELQSVFIDADMPIGDWHKIQNVLVETVNRATNKLIDSGHFGGK